jgi:putative addiction module antidote
MIRKIFKTGNSMVVSLSKEMLDALQLSEGSELRVELDLEQGQIVITPTTPPAAGVDAAFARQVADFIEEYRPALETLA